MNITAARVKKKLTAVNQFIAASRKERLSSDQASKAAMNSKCSELAEKLGVPYPKPMSGTE